MKSGGDKMKTIEEVVSYLEMLKVKYSDYSGCDYNECEKQEGKFDLVEELLERLKQ